ncbi:LOW QUALITY PROTEIN: protocadherin-8 [Heteronotia binoei]|uniref:LOW QUALITY PROTEIN: protocadherin-8 n=1 Tax=Heteronotia binoei TaxID=13085 RepID=UPI00292E94D0|nr:LOW QUALITY PROTEIN: protocadherin-8 [Heteronotia binoei]
MESWGGGGLLVGSRRAAKAACGSLPAVSRLCGILATNRWGFPSEPAPRKPGEAATGRCSGRPSGRRWVGGCAGGQRPRAPDSLLSGRGGRLQRGAAIGCRAGRICIAAAIKASPEAPRRLRGCSEASGDGAGAAASRPRRGSSARPGGPGEATMTRPASSSCCCCRRRWAGAGRALLGLLLCLAGLRRAAAGKTLRYGTLEEDPPGTVIGTLAEELPAAPGGEARSFRLLQRSGNGSWARVEVRERDGQLSVGAERLDREALCAPSEAPCVLAFDVVSLGGRRGAAQHFGLVHVELEVRDINDHAPRFPQAEVALEVSESAAPGTRLPLPLPHDPDAGANGVQSFALAPPHGPFGLETQSRADGRRCAELVLLSPLDREAQAAYSLELLAKDGGSPARSGTATLRVRVLDANDHAPAFPRGALLTVELPEDAPPGAPLLDLDAADPDEGANGQLLYSWGSQVPAEARARFALDARSGRLSLRAPVDYELQRAYELDVQASDRGATPLAASCKVLVRLLDVNDNAPALAVSALSPPPEEEPRQRPPDAGLLAYVSEAAPPESLVALVSASDADAGANGQVRVALLPAPQLPFALQRAYEASYALLTAGPLDRERVPEYNLTLVAEDLGSPPAKTVRHLTVRLTDENDNPPRFARPRAEVALPENNPPGAYLAALRASDPDLGPNGQVTYRLLDSQVLDASIATYVSVDPATGALYAVRAFNYELLRQLEVSVQATDGGSPPLSSTAVLQVRVVDQNDNAPVITHPPLRNGTLEIGVSSKAARDSLVTHVQARDADAGSNAELSFALLAQPQPQPPPGALDLFAISQSTGEISLARSLSEEQLGHVYRALLAVTDSGRPPLSTTATVSFVVTADAPPPSSRDAAAAASKPGSWEGPAVQWDVPLIVIIVLAGSCALLLGAIVTIATTCDKRRKGKEGPAPEEALHDSPREKGRQAGPASPAPSAFQGRSFPSPERSPAGAEVPASQNSRESTTSLYDGQSAPREPSAESYASTPSYSKEPGPPAAMWKGHSFNTISGREAEKFSGKDSGKGDSDFNDSDSDISGDALKKDLIAHMQNGLWACTAECKILGHSDRCWSPSCGRPNPHASPHPKAQLSTFCKSTSLPRDSLHRDHFYQAQLPKTVGLQSVYEKVLHRDFERTLTLRSPPHPGRLPDLQEISVPLFQDSPVHYLGPSSDATQKV